MGDVVRPVVDRDVCVGAANCVRLAPGVFSLVDGQGYADPAGSSDVTLMSQAIDECPVSAIEC
ncbi:hypothetical protein GCM10009555_003310 [Acrocarpospora macrocephala]|uniref:Ferredoxin n=1 Tax=Acrocarpospora macrocephala TaxID=150177 RepID=A0A5M3XB87_9ACTN|nr:ferredoxin [Acrocarpospora macrocephala]GES15298.1 hypothetical protein Amac_088950 [Acrocarpospora macrocephala]